MSIRVVCPGCRARFKVSDRFAGQAGKCPKCQAAIRVPPKQGKVKIHVPGLSGHGSGGRVVLKPIAREHVKLAIGPVVGVVLASGAVFAAAWLGGDALRDYWIVRAAAALLISPPLVLGGYLFLRDDENLDKFSGRPLAVRTAICSAAYALLWGVFGYVSTFAFSGEIWSWFVAGPPFVITGALVALACYDFDFGTGCLHYGFYLLATILLRGCAGLGWIWQLGHID